MKRMFWGTRFHEIWATAPRSGVPIPELISAALSRLAAIEVHWAVGEEQYGEGWCWQKEQHWYLQEYVLKPTAKKTERWHDVNFVVAGGTGGCRYDNLRCRHWRQSWPHGDSRFSFWYHEVAIFQQISDIVAQQAMFMGFITNSLWYIDTIWRHTYWQWFN